MSKTLIVFLLDESGSMYKFKSEVIEEINKFIEKQMNIEEDEGRFLLVKFNTTVNTEEKITCLELVRKKTESDYTPIGKTALYDAISDGINMAKNNKEADEKVIFVIMTDGEDNYSLETKIEDVKFLISDNEAKGGWTFLYIGPEPEKWSKETGMAQSNCSALDANNIKNSIDTIDSAIFTLRRSQTI